MMARPDQPLDTDQLKRVGSQIGSNPAGIYEDANGRRYYIKTLESAALARNEYLAAQLYQLAGAPTLTYLLTWDSHQIATRWLQLDKRYLAHFSKNEREQAQSWLGVHAWTANWDALGLQGDNQGVFQGQVLTLDLGGALAFRAQGDPKGKAFGDQVEEIDRLRNNPHNLLATELFGAMSLDAVKRSIERVTQIPERQILDRVRRHAGSEALALKMIARRDWLADHLTTL
ncbi:hypothetical protein [Marinobacterium lutimaris]|uniref:HipA-like C-terminal domain-containing protein n=1 Tax=Marinobacterium lutimaris TaxID=568106 RepID=A0A1H5X8J5_9GAMM|nr:hypothetical protein [Marinobacterium lutimaris]SEG08074.1 hypothetical protein SAMN05444390_1011305 [Marinobacterium lutimaris]